jgi:glycerate 2-kinase
VSDALLSVQPEWRVVRKPMADGGDGTAEVLHTELGGEWIFLPVIGPLPETPVTGRYLWLAGQNLAVVEMASASGLALLRPEQRNPLQTTTLGTGELIRDAVRRGARKILLGVGGSATVDGGVGAAMSLGWQFLDVHGRPAGLGGGELEKIVRIVPPSDLRLPVIEVLGDVDNPLCGEHGAARVFGPQKGATPDMIARLEVGLRHLAKLVKEQLGKDIDIPGGGAAGGLAGGAVAFMNARLVPGAETVMDAIELDKELTDADWVITGEGRFDEQSLRGKVVSGITKRAARHGVKVAVIAGSVKVPESAWRCEGIEFALPTMGPEMELDEAMASAEKLLASSARQLAARILA